MTRHTDVVVAGAGRTARDASQRIRELLHGDAEE